MIARPINVCATKQRNCNMTSFVKKKIVGKRKIHRLVNIKREDSREVVGFEREIS